MSKNIKILIILCAILGFLLLIPKRMAMVQGFTGRITTYHNYCKGFSFDVRVSGQIADGGSVRYCIGIPYK